MPEKFDLIVIGSGFGGAVTACRAAQAGARVLVLERGRRWSPSSFPRGVKDPWLFDNDRPVKKNGWLDLRLFKKMTVIAGAGVGGGSLCYSSVIMPADRDIFENGWPEEITFESMQGHYQKASEMLGAQTIPTGQVTQRNKLLKSAAQKAGYENRFFDTPLAIAFDEEFNYELEDPIDKKHTKAFQNRHGRWQGTCVHLGNCDIGCNVRAKNTLDLNYLAEAELHGAQIRPLHLVRSIAPDSGGYRVSVDRIESYYAGSSKIWGEKIVLAADSIGSTELLSRCRDQHRTLPKISQMLGKNWSANGNFLTPAIYKDRDQVRQGIGPTISSALDFMDGTVGGHQFVIEDDGFPNVLLNALNSYYSARIFSPIARSFSQHLDRGLNEKNPLAKIMIWLGAGVDSGDGELSLKRKWYLPFSSPKFALNFSTEKNADLIEAIIRIHDRLTQATDGKLYVPKFWKKLRMMITVHPLGGCRIGQSSSDGVVNHCGEVFEYKNLFVIDGAMIPKPIGTNPSLTIAALAERAATINF